MSKWNKRVLTFLLAICLVFGGLSGGALAAHSAVETMPQSRPFTDVRFRDWFFPAVEFVHEHGIMSGTAAATFSPEANFSRAMVVRYGRSAITVTANLAPVCRRRPSYAHRRKDWPKLPRSTVLLVSRRGRIRYSPWVGMAACGRGVITRQAGWELELPGIMKSPFGCQVLRR